MTSRSCFGCAAVLGLLLTGCAKAPLASADVVSMAPNAPASTHAWLWSPEAGSDELAFIMVVRSQVVDPLGHVVKGPVRDDLVELAAGAGYAARPIGPSDLRDGYPVVVVQELRDARNGRRPTVDYDFRVPDHRAIAEFYVELAVAVYEGQGADSMAFVDGFMAAAM